jgi:hypothetical protein
VKSKALNGDWRTATRGTVVQTDEETDAYYSRQRGTFKATFPRPPVEEEVIQEIILESSGRPMDKREHFQASSESESGWRQFSATDGQERARSRDGNSSLPPTDERVQVQGTDGRTDAAISGKFQSCFKMNFYFRPTKKSLRECVGNTYVQGERV